MVRQVILPSKIKGRMYLHHMPGRYTESLDDFIKISENLGIIRVICLTPKREIEGKSRDYASALDNGSLPWITDSFPIEDFGCPVDPDHFLSFCLMEAANLVRGEAILLHCGAGVGRTSTCAIVILMILGWTVLEAKDLIFKMGSRPDTDEQRDLVKWCAEYLKR